MTAFIECDKATPSDCMDYECDGMSLTVLFYTGSITQQLQVNAQNHKYPITAD